MKGISVLLLSALIFCYSCTRGLTLSSVHGTAADKAGTSTRKGRFKALLSYIWKKIFTFYDYVMMMFVKINAGTWVLTV